jgi:hypothetical protein
MGDRINFGFTTDTGDVLYLYSHWGAGSWIKDLQDALNKASGRFNDNSYAVRITTSQLIGEQWDETTGYGFSINTIGDSDVDFVPTVDFKYGFVHIYEMYENTLIGLELAKIEINKFIELDDLDVQGLLNDAMIERYGKND